MRIDHDFLLTIDWAKTLLGPMESWPRRLTGYVQMILELPTPAVIFWGPEQTQIYNDGYAVIMGPRHPRYFGGSYRECWPDTYPLIMPWMRRVLDQGEHLEVAREAIPVTRHGFVEETYFSFTFSPLRDDEGRIAGIYQPVVEMTDSVLHDRRVDTLRALSVRRDELFPAALEPLSDNPRDLPFAAVYQRDQVGEISLTACVGFGTIDDCRTALGTLFREAVADCFRNGAAREVDLPPLHVGPWPEGVHRAHVAPIRRVAGEEPLGVVVLGISPRLAFGAGYREFFASVTRELAANLSARRAEAAEREWAAREQEAHRQADAAREEQARRMRAIFEHAPVGIAVLRGPEHVFDVANAPYAALVGNRPLLGKALREALPELAGQGILELVGRVYATGEPFVGKSIPIRVVRPDGVAEDRFFEFAYEPIKASSGETESIIVVVFEVTELANARRAAEAASRAKDEFFAMLGHELRNPLAPIITALEVMRLRSDGTLAKERTIIERQVAQISRLVDDLLDVSRITGGKVELRRSPIELSDVVTKALETTSPLLAERRHRVDVDVPSRGLVVFGDATRLAQVVSNLLTNAAKYTEPEGHIRISAEKRDQRVVLRVADSGIGIAPEMLPRVFEPFAQDEQSIDRALGGLGLGLAIVANLMKLHDGTVEATSPGRGHGSTFSIELPLTDAPIEDRSRAQPVPARPERPLRVLIVDDNEDAASMLAEMLEALGHVTRVAYDSSSSIAVAEEFAPDVALLDIGLPVMDGYELAARLRASARGDVLKLFAVTGYGQEADRARALAAGFDAHLVKPVQMDTLMKLLERARAAPRIH